MAGTQAIYRRHGFEEIVDRFYLLFLFNCFFMKKLVLASAALLLAGCANTQHNVFVNKHVDYNTNYNTIDYKQTDHFFVGGIFQDSDVNAGSICAAKGKKVDKVVVEQRWYQALISGLTMGIYTPRSSYVWCEK